MALRSGFLPTQVNMGRPLAGLISTRISALGVGACLTGIGVCFTLTSRAAFLGLAGLDLVFTAGFMLYLYILLMLLVLLIIIMFVLMLHVVLMLLLVPIM